MQNGTLPQIQKNLSDLIFLYAFIYTFIADMGNVNLILEGSQEGIIEGESAVLRCNVESDPEPNYIDWYIKVRHFFAINNKKTFDSLIY